MMDMITSHHAMKIGHYRPLKMKHTIVMTSLLLLEVVMRLQGTLNKDAISRMSITTKNCSEEMGEKAELLEGYSQVG
jgi:hypothetical protein